MKVLEVYDDLAFARSQAKLLADVTLTVSVAVRDARTGRVVKADETFVLDLGEGNWQDVGKYLSELADAGKLMQRPASTTPRTGRKSGNVLRTPKENKALIKWVKDNQIMHRDDPTRLAYTTKTGKNYYPGWLWVMYDAAMEAADGVGGAGPEQRESDPGDRG